VKASIYVGTSVDGFIARPDGSYDFLDPGSGEAPPGFDEFLASVDALVMGRNTYDVVLKMDFWPYGARPVFVLSTRPLPPARTGSTVERVSGAPLDIVTALGGRGIGHIYVDGGLTIQQFLRAGLITNLIITQVPVLIGQGIPLFGPLNGDIRLRHVSTRVYSGAVQTEYVVA